MLLDPEQPLVTVAAATHDLKTPLTSLTLWMDNAALLTRRLADHGDTETVRLLDQALSHMQSLVQRSVNLLDDLLDIVQIEAGHRLPFTPSHIDLVALVRQVLLDQPAAAEQALHLESLQPEVWGWWDAGRLARLVENLVANAVKYSEVGESIFIRLRDEQVHGQRWAVLDVEDRGVGIPADDLPRVCEPFRRGANVTDRIDGTGLGLWACRAIVEQHAGALSVVSRENVGTNVTVRLPCSPRLAST